MTEVARQGDATPRQRLKRYALYTGLVVLVIFLLIRYVPTRAYEGTVQRVYEKVGEFRVEMNTEEGEVRVFTNSEMRFPYLKYNTADLQANLDRAQREGDRMRIRVWGYRSAFLSAFPNVVDYEVLEKGTGVRRSRSDRIVRAVMAELRARQLVPGGEEQELREALRQVIDEASEP